MTGDQGTVPNYMTQAILATVFSSIFCCGPVPFGIFGIIAIVFASQVNTKLAADDIQGARQASNQAKLLSTIGFVLAGIGFVVWIIYFLLAIVVGIMDAAS